MDTLPPGIISSADVFDNSKYGSNDNPYMDSDSNSNLKTDPIDPKNVNRKTSLTNMHTIPENGNHVSSGMGTTLTSNTNGTNSANEGMFGMPTWMIVLAFLVIVVLAYFLLFKKDDGNTEQVSSSTANDVNDSNVKNDKKRVEFSNKNDVKVIPNREQIKNMKNVKIEYDTGSESPAAPVVTLTTSSDAWKKEMVSGNAPNEQFKSGALRMTKLPPKPIKPDIRQLSKDRNDPLNLNSDSSDPFRSSIGTVPAVQGFAGNGTGESNTELNTKQDEKDQEQIEKMMKEYEMRTKHFEAANKMHEEQERVVQQVNQLLSEHKPFVLFLFSPTCGWCQKFKNEVMERGLQTHVQVPVFAMHFAYYGKLSKIWGTFRGYPVVIAVDKDGNGRPKSGFQNLQKSVDWIRETLEMPKVKV